MNGSEHPAAEAERTLTREELPWNEEYERMAVAGIIYEGDPDEVKRRLLVLEEEGDLLYRVNLKKLVGWVRRLIDEGIAPGNLMRDEWWGLLAAAIRHRDPDFWEHAAKKELGLLLDHFSPSLHFEWLTEQLAALAVIRERMAIAQRELGSQAGKSPEELQAFWEEQNLALQQKIIERRSKLRTRATAPELLTELREKHRRMVRGEGLTLGFPSVDDSMSGLSVGDMVCLCARAGVGKTTLVANLICHLSRPAANPDNWRLMFSMDMAAHDVFEKLLMRSRALGWRDLFKPDEAEETMKEGLSVHGRTLIDNSAALRVPELEARTMSYAGMMGDRPPELIIVDHHGHIKPRNPKLRSRYEIASETIQDLKQAAKRLDTVILVLVQLSRKAGEGEVEVSMDMLRDSGVIEEEGDLILGAWRPNKGKSGDDVLNLKVMKARRMGGRVIPMEWRPEVAFVGEQVEEDEQQQWFKGTGASPERDDDDNVIPF